MSTSFAVSDVSPASAGASEVPSVNTSSAVSDVSPAASGTSEISSVNTSSAASDVWPEATSVDAASTLPGTDPMTSMPESSITVIRFVSLLIMWTSAFGMGMLQHTAVHNKSTINHLNNNTSFTLCLCNYSAIIRAVRRNPAPQSFALRSGGFSSHYTCPGLLITFRSFASLYPSVKMSK